MMFSNASCQRLMSTLGDSCGFTALHGLVELGDALGIARRTSNSRQTELLTVITEWATAVSISHLLWTRTVICHCQRSSTTSKERRNGHALSGQTLARGWERSRRPAGRWPCDSGASVLAGEGVPLSACSGCRATESRKMAHER